MDIETDKIIPPEKLKDVLITKTAIRNLQPESVVEAVISHQFKSVLKMMKVHHQVEISGFGKYLLSPKKVSGKLKRYEKLLHNLEGCLKKEGLSASRLRSYNTKYEEVKGIVEYLKTRGNGYEN